MSNTNPRDESRADELGSSGSSPLPEPTVPPGKDETLTGELGSEGGSYGELAQTSRARGEERAPLWPRLIAVALLLLLSAVLLWLVVTIR